MCHLVYALIGVTVMFIIRRWVIGNSFSMLIIISARCNNNYTNFPPPTLIGLYHIVGNFDEVLVHSRSPN